MFPRELLSTNLSDCGSLTRPVRTPLSAAEFKYAGGSDWRGGVNGRRWEGRVECKEERKGPVGEEERTKEGGEA